ncbi:MAG: thiamine pyrophosphate-requiring protein [Betaproteobacteria bacterium]|nr:thiamine pyrophosphate-requiring protein [Betaproteobacteria bacterium]
MATRTLEKVTVSDAYLALMADRGVDYLFGSAGTDFAPMIEALAKAQVLGLPHPKPVTCPHENTAQHMAIGYYLATGRPALTMHHVNVGTANALNGLLNAARGQVPMLFTAGRTPINEDTLKGHRSLDIHWTQEMFDQAAMTRESVKWDYELRNAEQLETIVDRMITISMSDPKGPVYLSLPREILSLHLEKFTYTSPSRMRPAAPSAPSPEALDEAASILAKAQHPVIISNWAGRNPEVMPALTALAERYAIPVVEYRNRYIAIPTHHPMMAGGNPDPFVRSADAILVLDTAVPWQPSKVRPSADCKVIHMAPDPLYTYVPVRGFPADLSLACASDIGLRLLNDAMAEPAKANATRIAKRREECAAQHAKLEENWARKLAASQDSSPIAPAWISHCINKVRTRDAIIVKESPLQAQYLDVDRPCMVLNPGAASGLGHGMGVALGTKLAKPDTLVIGTEGDGAYMYNVPVSAHYVAAEQQLPILWIVFNNQRWQAVRGATLGLNPDGYAANSERAPLTYFSVEQHYEKLVEVSGGYGERVTESSQLLPALERAMKAVMVNKRQALLNVVCDVDPNAGGD